MQMIAQGLRLYDAKKISTTFRWDHPRWGRQTQGVGKNCAFEWPRSIRLRYLTAENLCPSTTVVRVHNGALAGEYTVSSTTLLVVKDY